MSSPEEETTPLSVAIAAVGGLGRNMTWWWRGGVAVLKPKLSIEEAAYGYELSLVGSSQDILHLWGVLGFTVFGRIFKPGSPRVALHVALDAVMDDMEANKNNPGYQEIALDMSRFQK